MRKFFKYMSRLKVKMNKTPVIYITDNWFTGAWEKTCADNLKKIHFTRSSSEQKHRTFLSALTDNEIFNSVNEIE